MTAIRECSCEHKYQDEKYGKHKRLMNQTVKGNYRCTICGKERNKSTTHC